MKTALVCGAGGFIGSHMVKRLKAESFWVRGVDLKYPEFSRTVADDFIIGDLRDVPSWKRALDRSFDHAYQFAADMGGAGYLFTGDNDAQVMHNSAMINLHMANFAVGRVGKLFYASSACVYPAYNQGDPQNPKCSEESVYPADPDSEYGWEKLFSERMYASFRRNSQLDVRIGRFHNVFGPQGTWTGGKEKAPAAICRKVAEQPENGEIEVWGDGEQTRSFLYVEEAIEAVWRLMLAGEFRGPVNIGSEEMITINDMVGLIADIASKHIRIRHILGPVGVRGRNSDNGLIRSRLKWAPKMSLREGLTLTYSWIKRQVDESKASLVPQPEALNQA